MKAMKAQRRLVLTATLILAALIPLRAGAADPERITATIANPAGAPGRTGTVPVSIYISSYTDRAELDRLSGILEKKGPTALREELWDLEKGWIRIGNSLGYPVAVALNEPTQDGGRHILLLADRPILFFEVWNNTRSRNYPFALFDLKIGPDGTGSGEMNPAAQVRMANGTLVLNSFGVQPARLLGARVR